MSLKMAEYPLHQLICLGRLEIYIVLLDQIPTRPYQNPPSGLLRFDRWSIKKMKRKNSNPR